jgi:peptidoglycan/xylan/chitin deacetylase (PgdA/CDA1 family)
MRLPHRGPVALLYHGFATEPREDDPNALMVTAEAFRAQLGALIDGGWRPLDLDGYRAALSAPRLAREFLVTIDDGFQSVADVAVPILAELRVPAILFVPPAKIGGTSDWMPELADERLLDADGLRAVAAAGVDLGVHGLDHRDLVDVSDAELHRQIVDARDVLADMTGVRARSFAYPRGEWDDRARRAVEAAGYEVGFSVSRDGGNAAIARVPVTAKDSLGVFRLKLLPGYPALWRLAGRAPAVRHAGRVAVARVTRRS